MPKIERSVAYTFDAYSGGLKNEALGEKNSKQKLINSIFFKSNMFYCRGNDEKAAEKLGRIFK